LESEEEGQQAGVFIALTAIVALVIVGIALRSYWSVAFTSVGLAALIIWLKGISTLIGIKGGLINDLIVPIAMISLGVDFAVHAVRRYQEEKRLGNAPAIAFKVGITGVGGALVLAFASDSIAFLSNTSSGIEAVIHFGFAASIAVASAFVVLGLVVPLAVSRADENTVELPISSTLNRLLKLIGGLGIAVGSGFAIILMIAVSAPIGLAVLSVVFILLIVAPYFIGKRCARSNQNALGISKVERSATAAQFAGNIVELVVKYRIAVLLATTGITILAFLMAL
jgi:predicted RND superfamily exporter protein